MRPLDHNQGTPPLFYPCATEVSGRHPTVTETRCGRVKYYKSLKKEKDAEMLIPFGSGLGGVSSVGLTGEWEMRV